MRKLLRSFGFILVRSHACADASVMGLCHRYYLPNAPRSYIHVHLHTLYAETSLSSSLGSIFTEVQTKTDRCFSLGSLKCDHHPFNILAWSYMDSLNYEYRVRAGVFSSQARSEGSILGQVMWDLWRTKLQRGRFSRCFRFFTNYDSTDWPTLIIIIHHLALVQQAK